MEWVSHLAGEPHSDEPVCVSAVLRAFCIALNDGLDDGPRQQLRPYLARTIGTANDGLDRARAWMAMDWLIRVYTPAWLRLGGLAEPAARLAALAPVIDERRAARGAARAGAGAPRRARRPRRTFREAGPPRPAAWASALAAGGRGREAAWACAGAAAWAAARIAIGDLAGDRARAAARTAAGDAAAIAVRTAAGGDARAHRPWRKAAARSWPTRPSRCWTGCCRPSRCADPGCARPRTAGLHSICIAAPAVLHGALT